ncbi:MAG: 4-phosphoerythronate dehydrogenase [Gammaproteobacteria bacterium]|nr:4-phosphoerythronate dehydrogenase [Gammaproteobacteria bacterium]
MKLIADDKIPHVLDFFKFCDNIILLPGESISRNDLLNADILLTRTVTPVNADLLQGTSVKFVGSATTGTDHIDIEWLSQNNIFLAIAAGANSRAVMEYVSYCVEALRKNNLLIKKKTAGIIGCGRIGQLVAEQLQKLEFNVICYDPFLTEKLNFNFVSLNELIESSDLISIHTPLTKSGLFPTHHIINADLIKKIKSSAILINTSRGGVIDQIALLNKKDIILCLDVWEHEPHISLELLHKVFIGTPHIAGYSVQAKYRATEMIYESAATFFGITDQATKTRAIAPDGTHQYDPLAHTQEFQNAFSHCKTSNDIAKAFISERKNYPLR